MHGRAEAEITARALSAIHREAVIDRIESETQGRDLSLADYPQSLSSEAGHSSALSIAKEGRGIKL